MVKSGQWTKPIIRLFIRPTQPNSAQPDSGRLKLILKHLREVFGGRKAKSANCCRLAGDISATVSNPGPVESGWDEPNHS